MRSTPALIALVLSAVACAAEAATLEVRIEGLHGHRGHLHVAVAADPAQWAHQQSPATVRDIDLATSPSPTVMHFDTLPPGRYAVEVFQDLNDNGRVDFNWLHIPSEPVGCSRNPGVWRRPRFDECAFDLPADGTRMVVTLK